MAGSAQISLVGCLGKDPVLRKSQNNYSMASFPVACDNGYKSDTVIWFEAVAFGPIADACAKYLRKGNMVYITGKFRRDEWMDKATNVLRSRDKVEIQNIDMLDRPRFADKSDAYGEGSEPNLDFTENPSPKSQGATPDFAFDPTSAKK